ncbi:MAG: hypothetical protein WBA10_18635, partial [Elainellaceae cyanobacterium]
MSSRRHRHTGSRSPRRQSAGNRVLGPVARLLLRLLFALPRRVAQPRLAQAGFILPTVVLLLLVVSLTVGSITLRTFTRTTQAIGDRQQQVIYNAATPAIDRAKAKLEYLFSQDERLPSGVPGEQQLLAMMANDGQNRGGPTVAQLDVPLTGGGVASPYSFPGEIPIDIDGLAGADNAWQFPVDSDGDGEDDTVVAYSILFQTPANLNDLADSDSLGARATGLEVRNGPLSSAAASSVCNNIASATVQEGWFSNAGSPVVSKNFQVNAIAIPGTFDAAGTLQPNPLGTVATLEFQQDRQINQGNKWGAWFRNDLEVFPGPQFRWNGAMHTEGNFIVGESVAPAAFNAFLISSTASCLNTSAEDSEITLGEPVPVDNGDIPFVGQVISGRVVGDTANDERSNIHVFDPDNPIVTPPQTRLEAGTDSVAATLPVADLALDPIRLLAEDISVYRNPPAADIRDADWPVGAEADGAPVIDRRIRNQSEPLPRVGDSYRADDRYGPQPRYAVPSADGADDFIEVPALGVPIPAGNAGLVGDGDGAVDAIEIGLDGYWERRARNQGMRIVVGPRLQLGDPYGWSGANESLYPFDECTANNADNCHKARQRRTLADHLAAVQATAIYRAGLNINDSDVPRVCLATTGHPGTAKTLRDSATFEALEIPFSDPDDPAATRAILTDFFTGRGTNGWEFDFPYLDDNDVAGEIGPADPLGIALRNLAQFAGDPSGGAPSFPPVQDGEVHPYPLMAMWGDFSKQRRVLELIDGGTPYATLSPADKSTLHTAICTLGMLGYNVNYLTQFDPTTANAQYGDGGSVEDVITPLGTQLAAITGTSPEDFIAELERLV